MEDMNLTYDEFMDKYFDDIYKYAHSIVMNEEFDALYDLAVKSVELQQEDAGVEFEDDEFDARMNLSLDPLMFNAIQEKLHLGLVVKRVQLGLVQ